jgi:hypothetical protein
LKRAEGLSLCCCNGLNKHDVVEYFPSSQETMEKLDMTNRPEFIYNADEFSCQLNNIPTKEVSAGMEVKLHTPKLVITLACKMLLTFPFYQ